MVPRGTAQTAWGLGKGVVRGGGAAAVGEAAGGEPALREHHQNRTAIRDPSAVEAGRGQTHNRTATGSSLICSQSPSEASRQCRRSIMQPHTVFF